MTVAIRKVWILLGGIFLLPVGASLVVKGWAWDIFDYLIFGGMLAAVGGACTAMLRSPWGTPYRRAAVLALGSAFLLVWVDGAVNLLGGEFDPPTFPLILATGLLGSLLVRFRPAGMAWVMLAVAAVQVVTALRVLPQLHRPALVLTAAFTLLWLGAAWGFRQAARARDQQNIP